MRNVKLQGNPISTAAALTARKAVRGLDAVIELPEPPMRDPEGENSGFCSHVMTGLYAIADGMYNGRSFIEYVQVAHALGEVETEGEYVGVVVAAADVERLSHPPQSTPPTPEPNPTTPTEPSLGQAKRPPSPDSIPSP